MLELEAALKKFADPVKAALLSRYFQTGPGQYAEGDRFLGLTMPQVRRVAAAYASVGLDLTLKALRSPLHEVRMAALVILVDQYRRAVRLRDSEGAAEIFKAYLANRKFINNWDLVDVTVGEIVGRHLLKRKRTLLYKYARSKNLWERRIAIVATQHFIRNKDYADTIKIARLLLKDEHDLIHKASGWMLREVGKRDLKPLLSFLDRHAPEMPRTMLRYSLEKLPEPLKRKYMAAKNKRVG